MTMTTTRTLNGPKPCLSKRSQPTRETATASPPNCSAGYAVVHQVSFPMVSEDSLRTLSPEAKRLLASFGIGGASGRRYIVLNVELETLDHPTTVLVTGSSGSGKSQAIASIEEAIQADFTPPPPIDHHKAIIDAWPDLRPADAVQLLARVGLADAFSWARKPGELSTGQRARFEIARAIAGPSEGIIIDEFCNQLDRTTAKSVAWSATKAIRHAGKSAILVTSIDDVAEYCQVELEIRLNWEPEPMIIYRGEIVRDCPLLDELTYERGDIADWRALKHLHYAAGDPSTIHSIHTLRHPDLDHPAAVAILSYPDLHSAARNLATNKEYAIRGDSAQAQRVNREVLKFTRIVVAPELRSCGLTKLLLPQAVAATNARFYECVTAMGKYSRFLQAIGFREVPSETGGIEAEVLDWANRVKVPDDVLLHHDELGAWIDRLTVRKKREARRLVWHYFHQFVLHRRTRRAKPKQIPGPNDQRWAEAYALVARRCRERPSYWILGPVDR